MDKTMTRDGTSTIGCATTGHVEETTVAFDDPEIGLAQRLVDTLPTFTVTGTGKQRCVGRQQCVTNATTFAALLKRARSSLSN